jgi:hypothetical protein
LIRKASLSEGTADGKDDNIYCGSSHNNLYWFKHCICEQFDCIKADYKKTHQSEVFTEPLSYCKCAGTIDIPDKRYKGEKVPESMLRGIRRRMKLSDDVPADYIRQTTFWRCMDSKVFICMVGANLPCMEKADLKRTPSEAMLDFCQTNPGQDYIPAYVTGHTNVYEWRCSGKAPVITKQLSKPDTRGFLSEIWFELPSD